MPMAVDTKFTVAASIVVGCCASDIDCGCATLDSDRLLARPPPKFERELWAVAAAVAGVVAAGVAAATEARRFARRCVA